MSNITFNELPEAVSQLHDKLAKILELLLKSQSSPVTETDTILNVQQVAELLNLSISAIYGLVHNKKIPASKRGKHLFFLKRELVDWIKEGRKLTNDELDKLAKAHLKMIKTGGKSGK